MMRSVFSQLLKTIIYFTALAVAFFNKKDTLISPYYSFFFFREKRRKEIALH
jgi:hypothetical protein